MCESGKSGKSRLLVLAIVVYIVVGPAVAVVT